MAWMQLWARAMSQQATARAPDGAYGTDEKGLMVSCGEVAEYSSLERQCDIGE